MSLSEIGEFGLIARWEKKLARRCGVALGIGDDAAVLDSLSAPIVTCDALVENVHFRRDWSAPFQIGRKAIAVNVSDIAAMGGTPVAAFIALAASPDTSTQFLDELYEGLENAAEEYGLSIAGGDLTSTAGALTIAITIIGNAPRPVLRSGAQVGDVLIVSGTLGDAGAGLELLKNPNIEVSLDAREFLLGRHLEPVARLQAMNAALAAVGENLHAALDLSDGLSGDAAHIANRSGVSLEIETAKLPISSACREAAAKLGCDALDWALCGGEDYELLLCVREDCAAEVMAAMESQSTASSVIGRVVARGASGRGESDVVLINKNGRRIVAPPAFRHF